MTRASFFSESRSNFDTPFPSGKEFLLIALFTLAAAALRFFRLGDQSLWNDEMFSFEVAGFPLQSVQTGAQNLHPPFYFWFLHGALALLGQNAWSLRVISAAAGALTVGLVLYCGTRLAGVRAGIAAALLCFLSPFHLAYSQEGRPYALAGLLALLSCCGFLFLLRERSRRRIILYCASSLLLLYTHYWGFFVLAGQAIALAMMRDISAPARKTMLYCWAAIAVAYLPQVPALLGQARWGTPEQRAQWWFWSEPPGVGEMYDLAGAFSGSYFRMASALFDSPPAVRFIASASLIVLVAGAAAMAFRMRSANSCAGITTLAVSALLIPFLLSFFRPPIFLWYRYTVILFPLFCVAIGCSLWSGPGGGPAARREGVKRWGLCAAAIVLIASLDGSVRYFSWSKSNVRDVALYAGTLTTAGAGIVIRPRSFAPLFNYYYRGKALQLDEAYLDTPLGAIIDTASSFVYCSLDIPSGIREYMDRHFVKTSERRFPGEAHLGFVVGSYKQPADTAGG